MHVLHEVVTYVSPKAHIKNANFSFQFCLYVASGSFWYLISQVAEDLQVASCEAFYFWLRSLPGGQAGQLAWLVLEVVLLKLAGPCSTLWFFEVLFQQKLVHWRKKMYTLYFLAKLG